MDPDINTQDSQIFAPVGEMNIYTVMDQKNVLENALSNGNNLTLDLSKVVELDSAGLQLLIITKLECDKRNIQFKCKNISKAVMEVLELTNMSKLLEE